jgi:hypothetical protein
MHDLTMLSTIHLLHVHVKTDLATK